MASYTVFRVILNSSVAPRQIVAYIPEYDAHIANLTVRETLEFAYNSMEGSNCNCTVLLLF